MVVVLNSGERKSPAFHRILAPVHDWEREEIQRTAPENAANREHRRLLECKQHEDRRAAAKGDTEAEQRTIEMARQLAGMPHPSQPTVVFTDAASAALINVMAGNGERALIASPEGDALDAMTGRGDNNARPNLSIYLKGYDGERVCVLRRGHPQAVLSRPAVSIAMAVQPDPFRRLWANRVAQDRGVCARMFVAVPIGMMGNRPAGPRSVPTGIERAYHEAVRRVLELPLNDQPRLVKLSREAATLYWDFYSSVDLQQGKGGSMQDQAAWSSKLCGGIAKLALGLHCLEVFGVRAGKRRNTDLTVNAATMRAALSWAPYLIAHNRIASGLSGNDPDREAAERVLEWLKTTRNTQFALRDCFIAVRGSCIRTVKNISGALVLLQSRGYLRERPAPKRERTGGRPPSPVYDVSPLWDR